jgi:hypothetical protein
MDAKEATIKQTFVILNRANMTETSPH